MCCIHGICILAPGANVSANLILWALDFTNIYCVYSFGSYRKQSGLAPSHGVPELTARLH